MSKVSYGFTLMNGETVVDEYQAKIVQFMFRLRVLDLTEEASRLK